MMAIKTPELQMAREMVRRASRISSLMAETSSRPAKAKRICGQKFTVSQFQLGRMLPQVKCVTLPKRSQTATPVPTRSSSGM